MKAVDDGKAIEPVNRLELLSIVAFDTVDTRASPIECSCGIGRYVTGDLQGNGFFLDIVCNKTACVRPIVEVRRIRLRRHWHFRPGRHISGFVFLLCVIHR